MASYGMNDVKNGMKILVNNDPCVITETEYVKPGKGQAFTRVRYRNLKTGRVVELTMKSTDSVEPADVIDTDMEFLYSDGEFWHFMDPTNHEQVSADAAAMADAEKWLKGNEMCVMTLWNGAPLVVTPPTWTDSVAGVPAEPPPRASNAIACGNNGYPRSCCPAPRSKSDDTRSG